MHDPLRFSRARRRWSLAFVLPLLVALAGCTVTFVGPGSAVSGDANRVIESFEARAGEGASYRVGEEISFRIRTRVDGYVTLTSLGPGGDVEVFARNVFVSARRMNVIDGRDQGVVFVVEPPRGWHRVRASFTPSRTDTGRVSFRGRAGEDAWLAAIRIDIEPFEIRDVAETRFYVR